MEETYRPLILLLLVGLCVSLISFCVWFFVHQGNVGFRVGFVTEVTSSSITVASRHEAATIVLVKNSTQITKAGESLPLANIKTGDFVQVKGIPVDDVTISAETILLLQSPGRGKQNKLYENQ